MLYIFRTNVDIYLYFVLAIIAIYLSKIYNFISRNNFNTYNLPVLVKPCHINPYPANVENMVSS